MWASITFTLYAALYIALVLFQLDVERNYWYNTALTNAVSNLGTDSSVQSYATLATFLN